MHKLFRKILNNKVFRNFSYLTIGSAVSQLIGLLTIIKITRIFAPADYGIFTFMLVQGQLLITIGDLGIRNIIIRTIARDNQQTNDLIYNGIKIRVLSAFALTLIYMVYNHYLGNLNTVQILLISSFTLINIITNLFESAFMGYQKMLSPSILSIVISALWFVSLYTLPLSYITVSFLFFVYIVLTAIKGVIFYISLNRQKLLVGPVLKFWSSSKRLVKESWPYFMLVLFMLPVSYLSNNFLNINSTNVELGYFNLAQKIMGPVSLVITFALSAIFPNLSQLWSKDEAKFYHVISVGFKYFMLAALLLCFLFTLFAKDLVGVLFTQNYSGVIKVFQLQIWFVFLMGVNSLIGTIWGATNKEKLLFKTSLINALISTPMLYYGSKFGALGLSYGYVISFAIFEIYLWWEFKRSTNIVIKNDIYLWLITLALFISSYFLPKEVSFFFKIIPAVIVLSIAGLYIYKTNRLAPT